MKPTQTRTPLLALAITLALSVPGGAFAYGDKDAIRDCESHLRSEYGLSDFRHDSAEKLPGEGHQYKVTGQTKVDGDKYPFECQIKDRHVTSVKYHGPEPEGMGTAEKLAVGAAAAIAAGLIASEVSKGKEEEQGEPSPTGRYSTANYDATTSLRCSMNKPTHDKSCPAGIQRGDRSATIRLTTPVGSERVLNFKRGDVTTPDGGDLTWGKDGDEWYIGIDNREFYIVPESAVYGG
jgi:hypothetical protein